MSEGRLHGRGFLLIGKTREVMMVGPELLPKFVPGVKCHELLFVRSAPCPGCPIARVFASGERLAFEWQPFPDLPAFDLFFTPILDEKGAVSAVAEEVALSTQSSLQELQELGAAELMEINSDLINERLRHHFKNKVEQQRAEEERNFIRLAAHQMQHPIALLRGYLELFLDDPSPTNHAILEEELQSLAHLVSSMLLFAHNNVDTRVESERMDAITLNRQVFDSFVRQYPDRKWKFVPRRDSILVMASPVRAQHFIGMFLENAVKYSSSGDKIELTVDMANNGVRTVVYNEGRGIAPENIDRIFEPFFRESRDKPGTGLGLAIAKKLIERRGGYLRVEAEKEKFARFESWIPFLDQR